MLGCAIETFRDRTAHHRLLRRCARMSYLGFAWRRIINEIPASPALPITLNKRTHTYVIMPLKCARVHRCGTIIATCATATGQK